MWPILAVAAVSSLMQYYQSEKARGATAKRLKEIEKMFNDIVPPEFDLSVYDDPELAKEIPPPALNMEKITPELYQSVGQYVPEVAEFVQEANPKLVEATAAAKVGRQAQMDALERYKKIASGEFDPEFAAKMVESSDRARRDANSVQDSILQDAQQRGQFGSGVMLASQMGKSADAMRRQAIESRMAAAEAYRNQLSAMDKSADLGGSIRRSEMDEEAKNVGIINDFNERTSKNYQDYLSNRANMANSAKLKNLSEAQRIADLNTGLENKAKIDQVERYNAGQKTLFDAAQKERSNRLELEDKKTNLKQQMYENLMAKARGKAGIAQDGINYLQKSTQDKNQAIQGVSDAAIAAMVANQKSGSGKYGSARAEDGGYGYQSAPKSQNAYGYDDDETMMG